MKQSVWMANHLALLACMQMMRMQLDVSASEIRARWVMEGVRHV